MTTALYRRYRPETFGEMIGQSQVTDPLMTALRGDRVGHAYLFSGPRGCGKTTSARILARCLNCAEGPTDTPCGTCPSCVELSRAGGGSLDVVEIDAASHNGVDDARDLRERATFAPSRDRYKIFILDEAHMVTPQGFNALLKLVEEPPPHVKFIFATTEPEKVLGTIRSRTHHYPFRLVPPAAMLEYVEKLCTEEGVIVEQGVLPLVVRAGGGSPRDTLSLLDQLIAGSDAPAGSETVTVGYERAVALLGYTHGALLDEIVDALAIADAATAFPAIDRVVQTGQDPRRFVDDLLERLRDLIVIAAVGNGASAVLRGLAEDELERMRTQAAAFGAARLSRTADVVSAALDDMSGATSPRLHLELMVARVLAGGADAVAGGAGHAAPVATASAPLRATASAPASASAPSADAASSPGSAAPSSATAGSSSTASDAGAVPAPAAAPLADAAAATPSTARPSAGDDSTGSASTTAGAPADSTAPAAPSGPVTLDRILAAWPAVLTRLEGISRSSWLVVTGVQPLAYDTDSEVLTVGFASQHDVAKFKGTTPGSGTSDHLRTAIEHEVGVRVKYLPAPLPAGGAPSTSGAPRSGGGSGASTSAEPASKEPAPAARSAARAAAPAASSSAASSSTAGAARSAASPSPVTEWAVATIPTSDPSAASSSAASATPVPSGLPVDEEPEEVEAAASAPVPPRDGTVDRDEPPLSGDAALPGDSLSAPVASPAAVPAPASRGTSYPDAPYADAPDDADAPYPDDEPPYEPAPPSPAGARVPAASTAPASAPARSAAPTPAAPTPAARALADDAAPRRAERSPAPGGVQRYGEAVIRQVLGATFVREEPYEPPTRFA
ncbi:DNA polymerase III subunit gamma and tau [uncultured Microbacterium sp.]|uniref:DNA polymerase III subunit gamma and tau n=1 Tax=uncultured Microbacterium sp. TaxID=191216 RepID=UPI0028DC2624|nr:DNA polymerase III subunit gamma and tau [uncultured Microbacterium sp.]